MTHRLSTAGLLTCLALALAACGSGDTPAAPPDARGLDTAFDTAFDAADDSATAVVGETVYVPAYSHISHQDGTAGFDLTTTLSIRNTDPEVPLVIAAVGYYDSDGRLVRRYGERSFRLGPLASAAFVVEARDRTGGVGANFLVEWSAAAAVSSPIIEAVMISTASGQGLSLVSRGQAVRTLARDRTGAQP